MKLLFVLGTRPEIIKLSPMIRYLQDREIEHSVLHTNQHYDAKLDTVFFDQLKIHQPEYNLNVGSLPHGAQTGKMMQGIEEVLLKDKFDAMVIQGDTNSVLAGALVGSKMPIQVIHIESGLRSYDKKMPEEVNREIADRVSDLLFVPTRRQMKILRTEGISTDRIHIVGNTIVDALLDMREIIRREGVKSYKGDKPCVLLTLHRPSNVDGKVRFNKIIESISEFAKGQDFEIIFPMHPRSRKKWDEFQIKCPDNLKIIDPIGYIEMVKLIKDSSLVLTDSGGLQEEACILEIPCLTLRSSTERPETIEVGANKLVAPTIDSIEDGWNKVSSNVGKWRHPFGNDVTHNIMQILEIE